jgi:two-component system phosphate regulon sensor histidine kinase PhoR
MGRHSLLLVAAWVLGLAAGVLSILSPAAALLALPAAALAVAWLLRRAARQRSRTWEALRGYLAALRAGAPFQLPAEVTAEELRPVRDDLTATQRHLTEEWQRREEQLAALRRESALAQTVLGTMVEGVAVLDGAARFLYANRAARRLLELGGRDVTGRLLHELVRTPRLHEVVDRVRETGAEQHVEVVLSRKERTVEVSAGVVPLEPSPGIVLVLHDVTELRRLEQVRRDFVSNVSHELKTPLTSIQAYADALLDGGLEDPAINRTFLERIVEQSERLKRLIFDLLNLARLEAQEEAPELELLPLTEVVAECLPAHLSVAQGRGVRLTAELGGPPVYLRGDREGVRTIVNNLLRNALTYTPAGGSVTVRVTQRDEEVVLEVEDTGVGIAREHQQRIFERFFRVDRARSREVGGTGLGLSIVKHLVELCGGSIEVQSELGRGSLFRVRWPRPEETTERQVTQEDEKERQAFIDS